MFYFTQALLLQVCICFATEINNSSTIYTPEILSLLKQNRRILNGNAVGETRPYMVYLRKAGDLTPDDLNWLCGGVIIHEQYILTSAACVEDVKQFYVISGTSKWQSKEDDMDDDECIKFGAKRAIWKCVPKNYVYDGTMINNFRWISNDIAVVKVEEEFNFNRRIRGCEYAPSMIAYNNQSDMFESPRTIASVAGWGSVDVFSSDSTGQTVPKNSPVLLEAEIEITSQEVCKRAWNSANFEILSNGTICGRDNLDMSAMSAICREQHVNCELLFDAAELENTRRQEEEATEAPVLRSRSPAGGFCENDHGGPLISGRGVKAIVIGTMTASRVRENRRCYGPYLFTSVYFHRHLISCAINKDIGPACREDLRQSGIRVEESFIKWPNKPIGRMGSAIISSKATSNATTKKSTKVRISKTTRKHTTTKKPKRHKV